MAKKKVSLTIKVDADKLKEWKAFCKMNGLFLHKFMERAIINELNRQLDKKLFKERRGK